MSAPAHSLRLVGIHYSPWSQRARWALAHHHVPVVWEEYLPMLGELPLRIRTRRVTGRLTVPVLLRDGQPAVCDSFDIARVADELGDGPTLFPEEQDQAVRKWARDTELMVFAARQRLWGRIAHNREALAESTPGWVPRAARFPVAMSAVKFLEKKYGRGEAEGNDSRTRSWLDSVREALSRHGGEGVVGPFSYADIVVATALQFVRPPAAPHVAFGPATRAAWTDEDYASTYADLLAWRDDVYERGGYPGDPTLTR